MQRFNRFYMINKNKMSLQAKDKNVRVLSARVVKAATERTRPLSGIPNQSYTRRQMIINSYNSQGTDTNRAKSARQAPANVFPQNFESERYGKKASGNLTKEKEQMAAQIIGLKQTVNRLVEQLSHLKGKDKRKTDSKPVNIIEVIKEENLSPNQIFNKHLVSGIRGLYYEIKQKYEAKCQQLDNFIKKQSISKEIENEQYIKALENQVKNLKKRIENKNDAKIDPFFYTETQRTANKVVVSDLQNEISILTEKYKELKKKYNDTLKDLNQKKQKIAVGQALIKKKTNEVHALHINKNKMQKQLLRAKELNLLIDKELTELKEKYEKEVQAHQQTIINYEEKCKRDVEAVIKSKDSEIQSLQEKKTYLQKMIQDIRSSNQVLNRLNQELKDENIRNSRRGNDDPHAHRQMRADRTNNRKAQTKKQKEHPNVPYQNGKRIPQRADKKYNENATKSRKVKQDDVLEIFEFLRLKLIAEQYSIQSVKSLFDYNPRSTSKSQQQQEYITMREVKRILKETPFNLEQDDAVLISRYVIQDVQADNVYCDELNENYRQVVKSIVKKQIQEYPIYKEGSAQYYQMNQEILRYKNNLRSALKTIAKEGVISKSKLVDVMKNIGMEVGPAILQLILATLARKSKSLSALNYSVLF